MDELSTVSLVGEGGAECDAAERWIKGGYKYSLHNDAYIVLKPPGVHLVMSDIYNLYLNMQISQRKWFYATFAHFTPSDLFNMKFQVNERNPPH